MLRFILYALMLLPVCPVAANELSVLQPPFAGYSALLKSDPHSLIQLLQQEQPASAPEHAQHKLLLSSAYYSLTQPQPALRYAEEGLAEITEQQQPWLWHKLQLARAIALDGMASPATGMPEVNKALAWAVAQHQTALQADALFIRAQLYISLIDYLAALTDLQQALQFAIEHPDDGLHPAEVAGIIALVYEYRREDALAIPYFQQAADYHRQHQNWLESSIALYGLGRAYKNTGDLQQGLALLWQSAELAEQVDDEQGAAYAYKEIAGIEQIQQQYGQAKTRLLTALAIFQKSANQYMLLDVNISLIQLALLQNDIDAARLHLQQAYAAVDPQTMPLQLLAVQQYEAAIFAASGQYQQAYELLLDVGQRKQQLTSAQSTEQLHQLRTRYELEQQQVQHQLLQQDYQLKQASLLAEQRRAALFLLLLVFVVSLVILLTAMMIRSRQHRKRLQQLADLDSLTGLLNRRKVIAQLQYQLDLALRHGHQLTIAILDLDWFKQINDNYGHAIGDNVLKAFAQLCQQQLRHTDLVGRIGGEEFLIVMPHTSIMDAAPVLEQLRQATKQRIIETDKKSVSITVSIGVAGADEPQTLAALLARADKALYQAKQAGRDQVSLAEYD